MNRKEFKDELKMTYGELQSYLIQKYGGAKYDYFVNPECKSKNKKYLEQARGCIVTIWMKIREEI